MTLAVETRGLTKVYRRRGRPPRTVVDGLDLSMAPGQVLGLLGVNGAGKTTSIKMICGLVEPTAGDVLVNGVAVGDARRKAIREIGVVLEGTRNIYWPLSPLQNLRYFAALKGCHGSEQRARAERLLDELGLWHRRKDPVSRFSRGMQQKVAIACALIADPSVILLDEPTLGLDIDAARTVQEWITKLAHVDGKAILITSHQLDLVEDVCDRVAVINGGRLVIDEPTKDLLGRFSHDSFELCLSGDGDARALLRAGMRPVDEPGPVSLVGQADDQDQLHELLDLARRDGFAVVAVTRKEPSLEEVFLETVHGPARTRHDAIPAVGTEATR